MKHAHARRPRRYEPLSRIGEYKVEKHQIDPRGWKVLSPDGRAVGEVKDLVVDTERMRAHYLDVELDTSLFDLHGDPHVLVPVEHAHRDGEQRRLIVDGLTAARTVELIEARDRHADTFWEQWWTGGIDSTSSTRTVDQPVARQDLQRALDEVRPGEQVRIPVVDEEIIVERRPVGRHQ